MKTRVLSLQASSWSLGVTLFCIAVVTAFATRAETAPPIKIAVFDFELEDYSAGGGVIGQTLEDIAQLKRATDEARQLLAQSGRYSLVDVSHADAEPTPADSPRRLRAELPGRFQRTADQVATDRRVTS